MPDQEVTLGVPKNLNHYKGQFIVFFSDDRDPEVLFNSVIPDEAYTKAHEIEEATGRKPTVYRIPENPDNNNSLLARRA